MTTAILAIGRFAGGDSENFHFLADIELVLSQLDQLLRAAGVQSIILVQIGVIYDATW